MLQVLEPRYLLPLAVCCCCLKVPCPIATRRTLSHAVFVGSGGRGAGGVAGGSRGASGEGMYQGCTWVGVGTHRGGVRCAGGSRGPQGWGKGCNRGGGVGVQQGWEAPA